MAATPIATLIDVVVLVFARSELKTLVGTDALRTVLNGSHRALFPEPQTMSLQPIWELIEDQPGFDREKAIPPMCRLKTWEGQLKVKVVMPVALEALDGTTREQRAMQCNVGDDDLNKLLKPPTTTTPVPSTRMLESGSAGRGRAGGKRRLSVGLALGFAVLGLAAVGVSLYLTFGRSEPSATRSLSAADLTTEIPLADVRRNGTLIVATVTDPATWLEKPESERRKQIEKIVPKARAQQATGVMFVDRKGLLLAMLRPDKNPAVTFPRR
jgi:hypothetical protein